jgi:hypothetical protein
MIYIVGTAQDVKNMMVDRPLLDLVNVKLIRSASDVQGRLIFDDDEIVYGHGSRQMPAGERWAIEDEIKMAQAKARANAEGSRS